MEEQLIMTVQSQSHISYSNLNNTSTQKSQEEFIFSIAKVIFSFIILLKIYIFIFTILYAMLRFSPIGKL